MAKPLPNDSNLLDHTDVDLERQAARTFGERLRSRAAEKDKGLTEIAKVAGIKRGAMTGYWAGERIPPAAKLFAIADFLETDARWLASGERPSRTSLLVNAADADWIEVAEHDLREVTDETLGPASAITPIRRDWLYAMTRATSDLWLTRLLSDYPPAQLAEDQLVICRTVPIEQLAEGNVCLWRVAGRVVIGRFSVLPDAIAAQGAAFYDPALGITTNDLVVPPSRAGVDGPYHLVGRILGVMVRPL